ncbi:hypothetical protein [Chitinophaga sp. 212800010-3]|uniref:hypothetical protein n=1 Tax=unclassified Chitinophaga TaxID=2619133 RepID=UPI002DE964E1|nr:hypothetical protein [Chitinophaga sp. 212800010-3]
MNETKSQVAKYLEQLEKDAERVKKNSQQNVTPAPAIIKLDQSDLIHRNTIVVVQGQTGIHKSRLSQIICSAIMPPPKKSAADFDKLGFTTNEQIPTTVLYVDTERNIRDQFPFAVQEVHKVAGYNKLEISDNFIPVSLINIPRPYRMEVLKKYVEKRRNGIKGHLFIALDVITDCIAEINSASSAFELIDWINAMCDKQNCTFLAVIHENPGSDKARGHVGTELENKATTAIAIRNVKSDDDEDIFEVRFKKTRNRKKPPSIYVTFDEKVQTLIRCEKPDGETEFSQYETILSSILEIAVPDMEISRADLCNALGSKLKIRMETIGRKLQTIINDGNTITTTQGKTMKLTYHKKGKNAFYKLVCVSDNTNEDTSENLALQSELHQN